MDLRPTYATSLQNVNQTIPNISIKPPTKYKISPTPPPAVTATASTTTSTKRALKPAKSKLNLNSDSNSMTTPANLARQILNNLNIFGTKSGSSSTNHQNQPSTSTTVTNGRELSYQRTNSNRSRSYSRSRDHYSDDMSSLKSSRRPSVDTVSTYLSHESKDSVRSRNVGSVSDLLDCSIGSDDVFSPPQMAGSIVGEFEHFPSKRRS